VYGLLENNADNFARADAYFERSLSIDSNSGEVLNWMRMNLGPLGREQEAAEVALRMVQVDPMSMITLFNGAATLSMMGDGSPRLVSSLMDRLDIIDPQAGLRTRSLVAEQRGQLVEALRYGLQALALDPDKGNVRGNVADLLARLGLYAEALHVDPGIAEQIPAMQLNWEEVLRLRRERLERLPGNLGARLGLLLALYRAGELEEAARLAEQLQEEYRDQPAVLGGAYMVMAVVARRTERPAQAAQYRDAFAENLRRWIEMDLNIAQRYAATAALAAYDGRDADALTALRQAIDRGLREQRALAHSVYDRLRDTLEFQSLQARMLDLAEQERQQALALLCAPGEPAGWEPAAETCGA